MTDDDLSLEEERLNELATGYVERMVNGWMAKGLPLPVLARALIGFGTSCIEGSQGHGMAVEMIDEIRAALEENRPRPPLAS